jgi:hypothetical protein
LKGVPKQKQGRPEGSRIVDGKLVLPDSKKRPAVVSVSGSEKMSRGDCSCDTLRERVTKLEKELEGCHQVISEMKRDRNSFETQVQIKEVKLQGELKLRASIAHMSSGQRIPPETFTTISPIKYGENRRD